MDCYVILVISKKNSIVVGVSRQTGIRFTENVRSQNVAKTKALTIVGNVRVSPVNSYINTLCWIRNMAIMESGSDVVKTGLVRDKFLIETGDLARSPVFHRFFSCVFG